ncbi:MAG: magnesium transporter CorA family protein [Firmicutes bacterium]|nr:magnesium transporter CorA family protein [Bacillota bacterium]
MIKIYKNDEINTDIREINNLEIDSWINVTTPNSDEITELSKKLDIDEKYLIKILDEEEQSRIDIKDGIQTIIIDVPTEIKKNKYSVNITNPLIIMQVRNKYIVTISTKNNNVLEEFISGIVPEFFTGKKSRFTFQILYKVALTYIKDLKQINQKINKAEDLMQKSTQNKDLLDLMHLRKALIYFKTSLKGNQIVLDRIIQNNIIDLYEDDKTLLENTIIEYQQAIEMAEIYNGLLNSTIDAYGTIISNNLNSVMKVLAAFTIVISIPTMVASFMGMNVPLGVFSHNQFSFLIIVLISLFLALIVAYILRNKNML